MKSSYPTSIGAILASAALMSLSACDSDMRGGLGGFDTTSAVRLETAPRPQPDARGVITYTDFQAVVARRGDTISDISERLNVDASAVARHNAIDANMPLRQGEIIILPASAEVEPAIPSGEPIDVETLASDALARVEQPATTQPSAELPDTGVEPIRHRVERGETAYSIARLYGVSVRSLADWNGLGPDLNVRDGQFLLIPVVIADSEPEVVTEPGAGSETPTPPSASQPLPEDDTAVEVEELDSPDLAAQDGVQPDSVLLFPVEGNIIRPYDPQGNGGIDIAAAAGAPVNAAAEGSVAAITQDTDNVPVLVIRHADNLLTVYANISDISVARGDTVSRGQQIATVRAGDPSFIRFEVRRGFDAIDPMPLLN